MRPNSPNMQRLVRGAIKGPAYVYSIPEGMRAQIPIFLWCVRA